MGVLDLTAEDLGGHEAGPACPYCHKPMKERKCWRCCIALCACGTVTGSAFISVCRACEVAEYRRLGVPY